jgi:hypothetical protein
VKIEANRDTRPNMRWSRRRAVLTLERRGSALTLCRENSGHHNQDTTIMLTKRRRNRIVNPEVIDVD